MSALNFDFTQLTADGSTASIKIPQDGTCSFFAKGTFGSGTAALEISPDNTTFFTLQSLTSNGRGSFYFSSHEYARVTISRSTTPALDSGIR